MDRRRLTIVGGIVAVAVVVAVVAIVLATRGGGSGSGSTTSAGVTKLTPLQALQGIPQHGTTIGDPNAPATIEVFEDPSARTASSGRCRRSRRSR